MQTQEFYQKGREVGWFTEEDVQLGKEHLEKEYPGIFHYKFLDENIIDGLKVLKRRSKNHEIEEDLIKYQKGKRGGFGMTRGISEYEGLWADELYDYKIYDSCGAVEDYYNKELE